MQATRLFLVTAAMPAVPFLVMAGLYHVSTAALLVALGLSVAQGLFPIAGVTGLSQTFGLNRMLTIGMEFAAPKVAERAHDSECYCREAEAPIKG